MNAGEVLLLLVIIFQGIGLLALLKVARNLGAYTETNKLVFATLIDALRALAIAQRKAFAPDIGSAQVAPPNPAGFTSEENVA